MGAGTDAPDELIYKIWGTKPGGLVPLFVWFLCFGASKGGICAPFALFLAGWGKNGLELCPGRAVFASLGHRRAGETKQFVPNVFYIGKGTRIRPDLIPKGFIFGVWDKKMRNLIPKLFWRGKGIKNRWKLVPNCYYFPFGTSKTKTAPLVVKLL